MREEVKKDFAGTLEKIAAMGYDGVEFAGYWEDYRPTELKKILDNLGLRIAGSHIPLDMLKSDLLQVIEYQQELGNKKIICPYLLPEERKTKEDYLRLAGLFNEIGKKCKEHGITFIYHNHDFELHRFGDETGLEILLNETNPEWMQFELDIYWLKKAGEEPLTWLAKYQDRIPLIHLKDMTDDKEEFFAELGTGKIDFKPIINFGRQHSVEWWVVEQDKCKRDPLESIKISISYLKSIL
ncbi:sugar phosphate isomerase/epimerase [Caldalkalibacillus uzonensis]|uniref:Sugar phosphate isomerase/epimerase n=1 Tax=Caldalkalibacillus uzonensis TaxID=353224 RepID=A0ABU0CQW7_9BACI|nr:sugar phosphate isomerase/epimerase [Caldalkalibacillus uzonensis]